MQKVDFTLPTSGKWQSLVTKYAPLGAMVSADSFTEGSSNFVTHLTGNIEKRWTDSLYNVTNLGSGPLNDNYEMVFGNGIRNLIFRDNTSLWYTSGNNLAYEVYSPVNASGFFEYISYLNVAYMDNAIDNPLSYDINGVYGGVTYVPVTIAVTNYLNLVGGTITIGSTVLTEGVDYTAATSNAATLASIAAAIGAIAGTPYVVVNSGGVLSVTNSSPTLTTPISFSGPLGYNLSSISFPRVRLMGVTPPTSAPNFTANTSGGAVPAGAHTYLVTFLYYGFEESNGGPASTVNTVVSPNFTVHLTAIPLGGYGVTARNIYRDNNDGNYVLVGTLSNNLATTFSDSVGAGTLPLIYSNGLPPIYGLTSLWLSRDFVAKVPGEPSTLYWSTANQMDSWNPDNFLVCNPSDTITGLVVYQGSLFVFNQFSFGYITGNSDSSFAYQAVPSSNIGCVDNRSIQIRVVEGIPELIFCSAKGVYAYNGSTLRYISDPIEPDLNVNLSQINILNGTNTQVSLNDWQSGTSTTGINLTVNPGVLTTNNPTASFSTMTAWDSGTFSGTITDSITSLLYLPSSFTPAAAAGTIGSSASITNGLPSSVTSATSALLAVGATNLNLNVLGSFSRDWFLVADLTAGNSNPVWSGGNIFGGISYSFSGNAVTTSFAGTGNARYGSLYTPLSTAAGEGTWSFDVTAASRGGTGSGAGGGVGIFFSAPSPAGGAYAYASGYCIKFNVNGQMYFQRWNGGQFAQESGALGPAPTTLLSLGAFQTGVYTITRNNSYMWTVYLNGSSLGSVSDSSYVTGAYVNLVAGAGLDLSSCSVTVTNFYYSATYHTNTAPDSLTPINTQAVQLLTVDQLFTPASEGTVNFTATFPGATSLIVSTATSADNITYSSFVPLGALNAIMSAPARYLQIKFVLVSPVDSGVVQGNLNTATVSLGNITWAPDTYVTMPVSVPLVTTLSAGISNSVTTVPVASTASFPTAGAIIIGSEVIFYTNTAGASFTGCTRGSDGTTAASHLISATVSLATLGLWTSPVYDTGDASNTVTATSLGITAGYPAGTFGAVIVNGSTSPTMSPLTTTQTLSSPTALTSLSLTGARYYQVIFNLASTGTFTPALIAPSLFFNTTGTWISPSILTTTDATALTSLVTLDTLPGTSTVVTTIATSADDITYSAYTALGSASVSKYAKIKLLLTADSGTGASPTVTSTTLDWNLISTFISQGIDTTASPPSGFGLFTVSDFLNGGAVTFAFRTASTLVGLASAAWTTVIPGTTPSNTPLEFVQWEAIFSSTANHVPVIDSVTTRWLTGSGTIPVRLASLFFDKTYYLFASTLGNPTNNVCFAFDYLSNWREFNNITVADICTFFAIPYYLDAVRNNIYQWEVLLSGGLWGPVIPAPLLASASSYGTLAATTITNTGATVITGNLGLFPGTSVTGAPTVTGTSNVANTAAQVAQRDALAAYTALAAMTPTKPVNTTLSSATLTAGVYPYSSSASLTGTLTLSGSATDVFVFQIASTLTTATSSHVALSGVLPQNVFWQVGSSATLGTSSTLNGTIIANTSITVDGATVHGQLIALNGAITISAIALITSVGSGSTSGPVPFMMDVRTKDFNLASMTTLKNARGCWVGLTNTGTTITVYYSVDNGNTWLQMLESSTGANTYTTSTSGTMCNVRFVPDYAQYANAVAGTSVMFRVTSADSFPTEILFIRPTIVARAGTYIGVGL